jgi:hypothetical protein
MYSLKKEHRKFKSMLNVVDILHKHNIMILFYITPIDYQAIEKFVGNQSRKILLENIRTIKSSLLEKNIKVIDLAFELGTKSFTYGFYPNEHLKEKGRKFVAQQLSKSIKSLQLH